MAEGARVIGRYALLSELGRGGMGTVYLARQTDLDRLVAVKELPAFHATDAVFVQRFLRESRIAGSLQHANIVTVHDYFEHDGAPYIAMEYVARGSLRPLVGRLTLAQIVGVLEGLLAGLAHAESRGIVHRDLKPENLMVSGDGVVKIADFGIAKAFNSAAASSGFATRTGTTVGTPSYMAPEQAMATDVGPWTDLYAAGVIAYELLAGRVPFHDVETPVVILLKQVSEVPPALQTIDPSLDPAVCAWVERLLQKQPADRYPSAVDAWEALEEIAIDRLGPRWRRGARLADVGAADAERPLTPAEFESLAATATPPEAPADAAPSTSGFVTVDPRRGPEPSAPAPPSEEPSFVTAAPVAAAPVAAITPPDEIAAPPVEPPPPVELVPPVEPPPLEAAPAPAPQAGTTIAPRVPAAAPAPPGRRRRRGPLLVVVVLALLLVAGLGAAALLTGDDGEQASTSAATASGAGSLSVAAPPASSVPSAPPTTLETQATDAPTQTEPPTTEEPPPTTTEGATPPPDTPVRPKQQVALAASEGRIYLADAYGRVAVVANGTFRALPGVDHAVAPRDVLVAKGGVYVADDENVTRYEGVDLRPVNAEPLGASPHLARNGDGSLAAATAATAARRGRVCVLAADGLGPCARTPFAPTGLGVQGDRLWVADSARGRLAGYRRDGDGLRADGEVAGVPGAHGRVLAAQGRLAVAVERGVAVVGEDGTVTTIALDTTPGLIELAPDGRVVAPLPALQAVALVDPGDPQGEPQLVDAPGAPYAAERAGGLVLVFDAERRHLAVLDRERGRLTGSQRVPGMPRREVSPLRVRLGPQRSSGLVTTQVLTVGPTALEPADLRVVDGAVGDGSVSFELWSAGIDAGPVRVADQGGVQTRLTPQPGRLLVRVAFPAGAYVAGDVVLAAGGRAVEIRLTEPEPVEPPPETEQPQGTTSAPPSTTDPCVADPTLPQCPGPG